MKVKIKTASIEIEAELLDNPTAKEIYDILPIASTANSWGDEIYFEIPLHLELDDSAKELVNKGDLGFWPSGNCFCIFFGLTPASKGREIRPASAVNVFGKVKGGLEKLNHIRSGEKIMVER